MTNFHKVAVLRTEWEIPDNYENILFSRRSAFGIYWWVFKTQAREKNSKNCELLSKHLHLEGDSKNKNQIVW